jgi:hypothetical protein
MQISSLGSCLRGFLTGVRKKRPSLYVNSSARSVMYFFFFGRVDGLGPDHYDCPRLVSAAIPGGRYRVVKELLSRKNRTSTYRNPHSLGRETVYLSASGLYCIVVRNYVR